MEKEAKEIIGNIVKKQVEKEKAFFDSLQGLFNINLIDLIDSKLTEYQNQCRTIAIDDFFDLLPNIDKPTISALEKVLYKLDTNEIDLIINAFHFEKDKALND